MRLAAFVSTELGSRFRGLDAGLAIPEVGLVIVAHTLGGHPPWGAAELTVASIRAAVEGGDGDIAERFVRGAVAASTEIFARGRSDHGWRGQGAMFDAIRVDAARVSIAHVGLGRVLLVRDGHPRQLTRDHSLLEVATTAEEREHAAEFANVTTRALGVSEPCQIDTLCVPLVAGDVLALVTGVIARSVSLTEIAAFVEETKDLETAAEQITRAAMTLDDTCDATAALLSVGPRL